jgi:endonuclease/exonuclease/phosphatase family metal-dependent hydrolase
LDEQAADLGYLKSRFPRDCLIWAGDFNHSLDGDIVTSGRGRVRIQEVLCDLGLTAWNADAPHRLNQPNRNDVRAIDLVCGPNDIAVGLVEVIPAGNLSDHNGYVVSVEID